MYLSLINQKGTLPLNYEWYFGDGTPVSYSQNPVHEYLDLGLYNVTLEVTNARGSDLAYQNYFIDVTDRVYPKAGFTLLPQSGSAPLKVKFVDQSVLDPSGPAAEYNWSFGDGNYSNEQNPVWTYTLSARYDTNLTVKQGNAEDSASSYVTVSEYPVPNVSFSMAPLVGSAPLKVSFSDLTCRSNCSYQYFWQFGDGNTSTVKNPVHEYAIPGSYSVNLTVTDAYGVSGKADGADIVLVKVPGSENGTVVADFTATPVRGKNPLKVQFLDASSGKPVAWNWSFGDGEFSREESPVHNYQKDVNYTVRLDVFDRNGNVSTKEAADYIQVVSSNLTSRFIAAYPNYPDQKPVKFYDVSVGNGTNSWYWNFGDGTVSYESNPYHVYNESKCYLVTQWVSNGFVNSISSKTVCT